MPDLVATRAPEPDSRQSFPLPPRTLVNDLGGFGADGSASVIGWEGGALSVLPGGCKVGMRLFEDAKAPQQARNAVAGDKELLSNDANVRAVKPAVGEILIGY